MEKKCSNRDMAMFAVVGEPLWFEPLRIFFYQKRNIYIKKKIKVQRKVEIFFLQYKNLQIQN